jgi:nucleoside-diphosphate-sugar epimerase
MNVLLLGATGSIGASVVHALRRHGHKTLALARSGQAEERLSAQGLGVLRGDVRDPEAWADVVHEADAVIQTIGDFSSDAGAVDAKLVSSLLRRLATRVAGNEATYIYTGGCWLYGNTGERIASEKSRLNPPPEWAWSARHAEAIISSPVVRGIVIHPAMVYTRDGGVLAPMLEEIRKQKRVAIVASPNVRWPMVHWEDIGELYVLALEQGARGATYNGAAVEAVKVGDLARALAVRAGIDPEPRIFSLGEAVARWGEWALGYAVDQQMSGKRARRELGWVPAHTDPLADLI